MSNLQKKAPFRLLLATALLAGWAGAAEGRNHREIPSLLVMATVHDNPKKLYGAMQPMADYMAGKLAPLGIESIEVLIVDSHEQMVRLLLDNRVDWVTETAFSAARLESKAGAEILLRKWKQGVPEYRSLIFTRNDSGVDDVDDLAGHTIAFQHPGSTSGYYVPASALLAAGHRLSPLASVREQPGPDSLGFLFSGAEYNTALWVHKGLVDAGALSTLDWRQQDFLPGSIRQDLRIVYTSLPIPRALELVRGGLHPRVKAAIRKVLLEAHLDPAAEDALAAYHNTRKFDELDGEAVAALQQIRDVLESDTATTLHIR